MKLIFLKIEMTRGNPKPPRSAKDMSDNDEGVHSISTFVVRVICFFHHKYQLFSIYLAVWECILLRIESNSKGDIHSHTVNLRSNALFFIQFN